MSNNKSILANYLLLGLLLVIIFACKKPKNGEYQMTETGEVETLWCPSPTATCSASSRSFTQQIPVTINNSGETQFYTNNTLWQKNGKNISYEAAFTVKESPGSTISYTVSYQGKIIDNKNMEGTFSSITKSFSGGSVNTNTYSGIFQIKKIKK